MMTRDSGSFLRASPEIEFSNTNRQNTEIRRILKITYDAIDVAFRNVGPRYFSIFLLSGFVFAG